MRRLGPVFLVLVVAALASAPARADLAPEPVGRSFTLPATPGPHWFWLSDLLLHRTALFDADTGELLGSLSAGTAGVGFVIAPLPSPDHRELYLPESYYARGVRGERTDVVNVYDGATLAPLARDRDPAEARRVLPGKRRQRPLRRRALRRRLQRDAGAVAHDRRRAGAPLRHRGRDARAAASPSPPAPAASSCSAPTARPSR